MVETPADVIAIEESGVYRGRYFVLMGRLSPLDGIGPDQLGVPVLDGMITGFKMAEMWAKIDHGREALTRWQKNRATAKPGGDLAKVEKAIDEEVARFLAKGPTKAELQRAKTRTIDTTPCASGCSGAVIAGFGPTPTQSGVATPPLNVVAPLVAICMRYAAAVLSRMLNTPVACWPTAMFHCRLPALPSVQTALA